MTNPLHTTRDVAGQLKVSVWTVTRTAREHSLFAVKVPGETGAYLFADEHVAQLARILKREVAA